MARTFINQSTQIGNSENYDDDLLLTGSALQFTGVPNKTAEDDLNALRTMMKRVSGEENWYDAPTVTLFGVSGSLDTEISRATSAELSLELAFDADLSTELSRAQSVEASIESGLSSEVSRAQSYETVLGDAIVSVETNLSSEVSRAESVELVLDNAIVSVETNLSSEVSRAESVELVLDNAIISVETNLSTEVSRATSAEGVLTLDLSTEVSRATSAEGVLTSNLSTEVSTARSAEASVASGLSTEVSRATSVETFLSGAIVTEKGRIDAILLASNADYDTFAEIVQLINSVDTTNDQAFAAYVLSNDAALSTEVSRANSAEASVAANLSSEIFRATSAEAVLTSDLSSEISRAIAAEGSVAANLSIEVSRATSAETVLTSNLSSEISRATAAEGSVATNLSTEVSRATSAEGVLTTNLSTEVSRATSAEGVLTTNLSAEISRAMSVEDLKVNRAGDTMTGPLNFSGVAGESALIASASLYVSSSAAYTDLVPGVISLFQSGIAAMPTSDEHVTTKVYVDQKVAEMDSRDGKFWYTVLAAIAAGDPLQGPNNNGADNGTIAGGLPVALATITPTLFRENYDVFVNGQLMESSPTTSYQDADVAPGSWFNPNGFGDGAALRFSFPLVAGDKICLIAYT